MVSKWNFILYILACLYFSCLKCLVMTFLAKKYQLWCQNSWQVYWRIINYTPAPRRGRGVYCFTFVRLSILPSFQDIFRHIFLSNYQWQKSDISSQASYWYPISWEAFLDPSDSYFLFADFVDFYTHWTYMLIFRRIFLSYYWWQKSDIWSQASYRYPHIVGSVFWPVRFLLPVCRRAGVS